MKKKSKTLTKEYRSNEKASLVNSSPSSGSPSRPFFSTNRNAYQTIDGQNYLVRSPPNGGEPNLYQNITQSARADSTLKRPADAPPAYEQLP